MKKILSLFALILFAGIAAAQTPKFGIRARYTSAKMTTSQSGISSTSNAVTNVDAGFFAEMDYGLISFQPGLAFILKGGGNGSLIAPTTSGATSYSAVATELSFKSLELPLNVLFNIKLKPGKLFLGGGPFIAYNLAGKAEFDINTYNFSGAPISHDHSSQKISFTSDPNDFKRFEVGLNAIAGFRLNNGIELNLGLGSGLTNITNDSYTKITNHTLSAGLGYFFK